MPFKSKAQRRKFYALKKQGKMTQEKIDEWESDTPRRLPERKARPRTAKVRAGLPGGKTYKAVIKR